MHDFLSLLSLAQPLADSGGNHDITVAVVTTIGVVVAAGLTALAATLQKDKTPPAPAPAPAPAPTPPVPDYAKQYIRSLEVDRNELHKIRNNYDKLRDACWERGIDPDEMIRNQT